MVVASADLADPREVCALQHFDATDLVVLVTDLILCQLRHLDR